MIRTMVDEEVILLEICRRVFSVEQRIWVRGIIPRIVVFFPFNDEEQKPSRIQSINPGA